jgi:hypothetical protein
MLAGVLTKRYVVVALDCVERTRPMNSVGEFTVPVLKTVSEFRAQMRAGLLTDSDLAYLALDSLGML